MMTSIHSHSFVDAGIAGCAVMPDGLPQRSRMRQSAPASFTEFDPAFARTPHFCRIPHIADDRIDISDDYPDTAAVPGSAPGTGRPLAAGIRVKLHLDAIHVYSEGGNRAGEFVAPLHPAASGTSRAPAPVTAKPDGTPAAKRVLVVDDNADAADSTADLLRIFGYDVTVAHSGASALERLAEATFDTVLLDIGMPVMDGFETARRMREHETGRGMRLIAMTGWGGSDDVRKTRQAGFDEHWVKPIDVEKLKRL